VEAATVVSSKGVPALLGAAALFAPRLALACPSCAGNPDGGAGRYVLIGLMIAAPYVAATLAIRAIRKGEAALHASRRPRPGASREPLP
jgi:hypothetical protein